MNTWVRSFLVAALLAGGLVIAGCSSSPSDEELQQLQDLKDQVSKLETDVKNLEGQKADLEKQIADKNGKIQQCQSDQDAVKKAMGQ
jgi:outer membrane murein-binding lipoprotein Lpp